MILNERSAAPRNGIPVKLAPGTGAPVGYRYRARRPAWMARALAKAEAEHGPPVPTCVCGGALRFTRAQVAVCPACGAGPEEASAP